MQELLHAIGICPDSYQHFSVLKALLASSNELSYVYHYVKELLK